MRKPRVTYFDFAGSRGEEVRLAFVLAGVDFDDNRISREDFARLKPDFPFPYLPVLELDGHGVFSQTNAILRLVGRLYGLYPSDPYEAARHDEVMEAVEDLRHRILPTMRITDPVAKAAARDALARDFMPLWGRGVERLIGPGPFVGGDHPGVADIKLFLIEKWISSGGLDGFPQDMFEAFPKLTALANGIRRLPGVASRYAAAG